MAELKITLIKSVNSVKPDQAKTVKALGLRKIRQYVVINDNPCIRGMIKRVCHLVKVDELSEGAQI